MKTIAYMFCIVFSCIKAFCNRQQAAELSAAEADERMRLLLSCGF